MRKSAMMAAWFSASTLLRCRTLALHLFLGILG
jgi:hypothetical protein